MTVPGTIRDFSVWKFQILGSITLLNIDDISDLTKAQLFKLQAKILAETVWKRGRNFIYIARRYDSHPEYSKWMTEVEQVQYTSAGHKMVSWIDVDPEQQPERIWLLFGGNATVALDWLPVTSFAPASGDAFVMVEYPGYGKCEGKPSRRAIIKSVDRLIDHLCERFGIDDSKRSDVFRVMGSSLGSAIALQTAARHQIHKGVLIAPFTSIRDAGAMLFPKFLTYLAADPYDNLARLEDINEFKNADTQFHIVHGEEDTQLPISMGRKLHDSYPEITTLWPIPDVGHNDIKLNQARNLGQALTNGGDFSILD